LQFLELYDLIIVGDIMNDGINNNGNNTINAGGVNFVNGVSPTSNVNSMSQPNVMPQVNNGNVGLGGMVQQSSGNFQNIPNNQNPNFNQQNMMNGMQPQNVQMPINNGIQNPNYQAPNGVMPNVPPMGQPSMQPMMQQRPSYQQASVQDNRGINNFAGEKTPILMVIITILIVGGVAVFLYLYLSGKI